MPEGVDCSDGCTKNDGGTCSCDDLGFFDLKGQFTSIFANSALSDLGNVGALKDWKFYEDFTFWAVIVLTIWLATTCTVMWLSQRAREYSAVN